MVYVGGAVVSIYADDPGADDIRPTKDIDITLEIASIAELENIREELARKGFFQSHEETVICRFKYQDVLVDVMSTKEIGWAPANPWFKTGFKYRQSININNIPISILPFAYFLATKFSAYEGRGKDPRTSKDFEDIVYLLDNRLNLSEEIQDAPRDVKNYLRNEFKKILSSSQLKEGILSHLYYETQIEAPTYNG